MARIAEDLTGQVFGRLTVLEKVMVQGKTRNLSQWRCVCSCSDANEIVVDRQQLKNGKYVSCGCLLSEAISDRVKKHGNASDGKPTPEYTAWINMRCRCYDERDISYLKYGGRGIRVCDAWLNSFEAFLNYVGPRPDKTYSLDRLDPNKDYEPGNVEWAPRSQQALNKRNTRIVKYQGKRDSISGWAREKGLMETTIRRRLDAGWSVEDALETSSAKGGKFRTNDDATFASYNAMIGRCKWGAYKGVVAVCERWMGPGGFAYFLEDVGECPDLSLTLDRIDPSKDYEPGNVRWASSKIQGSNKRVTIMVEWNGERKSLKEWEASTGIPYTVLKTRIVMQGMEPSKALRMPYKPRGNKDARGKMGEGRIHRRVRYGN